MRQLNARILATLLWIKARYIFFMSRRHGQVVFFVFLIVIVGTFFLTRPVNACDITDIPCWVQSALLAVAQLFMSLLNQLIAVVLEYMVPVMLYNQFSTSPVVTYGWALVRDTVNMFFVIVLIIIAFGTIFGNKRFQWQQQVPHLLIFAIVINFSKTLAGLMIDFGQVVMLTFANALREIAAGNIIEMFGLNEVSKLSQTTAGKPIAGWDMVLAAFAGVIVLAWVLMIMLMMFAILVYRIIALWILIVVAPLAWFMGGTGSLFSSNAYADWWKKFKCFVAIGPILTFFLWLALAVAGAGQITQGFETGDAGNSSNFFTAIFELKQFMSLVIGSAILMAGMQQAQDICSVMGGASPLKIGRKALEMTAGGAFKIGGWTGRKVGGATMAVGRGASRLGGRVARSGVTGTNWANRFTTEGKIKSIDARIQRTGSGRLGRRKALSLQREKEKLLAVRPAEIAKAGEKYALDTSSTKADQLARMAKTGAGGDTSLALFKEALGDEEMMKQLEKSGAIPDLVNKYGSKMETAFQGDGDTMKKLNKFNKRHAGLTNSAHLLETEEDLRNLSTEAVADHGVQERARNIQGIRVGKGANAQTMNGMDAILQGKFGEDKKNMAAEGGGYNAFNDEQLAQVAARSLVTSSSQETVKRATDSAFEKQDYARIQDISKALMDQYKKDGTSDEKRFEISGMLDKINADLATSGAVGGMRGRKARGLQQTLGRERQAAELQTGGLDAAGNPTISNFGRVPPIAAQEDPSAFVRQNFADASSTRREDAKAQVAQQQTATEDSIKDKLKELKDGVKSTKGSLSQEAEQLADEERKIWAQLDEKKKELIDKAKAEARALQPQIADKQKEIDAKTREFSSSSRSGADIADLGRIRDEINKLKAEKDALKQEAKSKLSSVDTNEEVVALQNQAEGKQEQQVQALAGSKVLNVNENPQLKQILDAYNKAKQDREKIRLARQALDGLPPIPNA